MCRKAQQLKKRPDLHIGVLWSFGFSHLPHDAQQLWLSSPRATAVCKSLLAYLTHLVPSSADPSKSLAIECLSSVSHVDSRDVDLLLRAALAPMPSVLDWQVYTVRSGLLTVWDPISGPLSGFLAATHLIPKVTRAPLVEGPLADPESVRFLIGSKILHLSHSLCDIELAAS